MKHPPRLLFVVNHADFFLSHRLPLALAAREKLGAEVHVATMQTPKAKKLAEYDLTWHRLPLEVRSTNPFKELVLLKRLYSLYGQLQPDLIHHVTIKPVLYGSVAARLAGVPAVVNALSGLGYLFVDEGVKAALIRWGVTMGFRYALTHPNSSLILQNHDDVNRFRPISGRERIALIKGSGADLNAFAPTPEPDAPPVVVLPARMLWDKGVGEFVEAARLLKKAGSPARFALVGAPDTNNPASVSLRKLEAYGEEGIVEWWGYQSDMPAVYEQAHVVCLPSYREGLPKVLIEAAACARPIVATDVPGCREIVQEGENGLLVSPRDGAALAEALHEVLSNPGLREEMGTRGRQRVEEEFSLQKVVRDTMSVYKDLLGTDKAIPSSER